MRLSAHRVPVHPSSRRLPATTQDSACLSADRSQRPGGAPACLSADRSPVGLPAHPSVGRSPTGKRRLCPAHATSPLTAVGPARGRARRSRAGRSGSGSRVPVRSAVAEATEERPLSTHECVSLDPKVRAARYGSNAKPQKPRRPASAAVTQRTQLRPFRTSPAPTAASRCRRSEASASRSTARPSSTSLDFHARE